MLVEIINFFLSPLFSLFEPYVNRLINALTSQKTQRTAIKTVFIAGVALILVSVAFVAYLGFYMIYVPKIAHVKPVYLQYQKERSPYAIIDFTENGNYDNVLTADQAYDVSIDLDVPSSDRNVALGNFMIGLELLAKNETVQYSSRPCILTYQSGLFRVIYTFWRLIPLVLGFAKEDQKLKIIMFENMIESAEKPITKALVTVSNSNLEVYSTQIRLDAHFRGLRYFMYYHSIPTAIVFTLMFLSWEILFSFIAWKSFVSWWHTRVPTYNARPPITSGRVNDTNFIDNNHRDDESDRTSSRRDDTVNRRNSDDNETTTEATTETESEYESSRPGSIISPTDTALVSGSGDIYNTESYTTTDDEESQSTTSRPLDDNDGLSVSETDDDSIDDDDQTEGSATPTTRSRKSTLSETSTINSEVEDGPSISTATSISRLQSGSSKPYTRRSGSSGGNDESNME